MQAVNLNPVVAKVTDRIKQRSADLRQDYLQRMQSALPLSSRSHLTCGNIAHVTAAVPSNDKLTIVEEKTGNIGIVTAYNDMLSAHQPFKDFPDTIKQAARGVGATAQVAGGVPAMCDGVTQGQPGMELSLFSRDVIALSAAVSLSHNAYDAAAFLGVCDKIVPGLAIAAATFGYLPCIFLPAGPMSSGLSNNEKVAVRQRYADGKATRKELLEAEMGSYHGSGTCTFYGTANSNQMLMEFMGLQLPGSSFVHPDSKLRQALTEAGTKRVLAMTQLQAGSEAYVPSYKLFTEASFVNGIVGLNATGGSTNLVMHIIAMARAAGIIVTLEDFADLASVTPLMARVYPNGSADVNGFHAAGGLQFIMRDLLAEGLLHNDVETVAGFGLSHYSQEAYLDDNGEAAWRECPTESQNLEVIRPFSEAFQATGGLVRLQGNLGEGVIKASAVQPEYRVIEAPAKVFHDQASVKAAFEAGELTGDFICVVRFQGPKANGMPELHGLTPILSLLQSRGQKVALVTDGRMSGASGKIPAAIHVCPEALDGGAIALVQEGDLIRLDAEQGTLSLLVDDLDSRTPATTDLTANQSGIGRELFGLFRQHASTASTGALSLFGDNS